MANITLTEILGGDNIAGSRITINDNFKKVANAINVLETRLDTSYNPGGALNVGNAIIKRYTNPTSAQIFTCEATGLFQGNLNVALSLGVTQSATIAQSLTVNKNIVFDGSAVGGGTFTSAIKSVFSNEFVNSQLDGGGLILDPQNDLSGGTTRSMIAGSLNGKSVLRLDLSQYTGVAPKNCNTISLPLGNNGQILTVLIDVPYAAGQSLTTFTIGTTNLATSDPIVFTGNTSADMESTDIKKMVVTLVFDTNKWRVINVANPGDGVYEITY